MRSRIPHNTDYLSDAEFYRLVRRLCGIILVAYKLTELCIRLAGAG